MLELTLATEETVEFDNFDDSIGDAEMLDALFASKCSTREGGALSEDLNADYILLNSSVSADIREAYIPVIKAEWVDDFPDTSLHEYVLDELNSQGADWAMSWADGENGIDKPIGFITEHWQGFHEAVNNQINLDGTDFVLGNEFDLSTMLDLVIREIVRYYLRAINLY